MLPAIAVVELPCTSGICSTLHAERFTAQRPAVSFCRHVRQQSLAGHTVRYACTSIGAREDRISPRAQRLVTHAGPPEQDKGTMFEGKNVDEKDIWEGDLAGWLFKGGIVAVSAGVVVLLLTLAKPVIDNTIDAFPVR